MTDGLAGESQRRHFLRIGRLVCGLVAVMAVMAAVPPIASAQIGTVTPTLTPDRAGPPGTILNGSRIVFTRSGTETPRGLTYTFHGHTSACLAVRHVSGSTYETTNTFDFRLPRFSGTGEFTLHVTAYRGTGNTAATRCSTASGASTGTGSTTAQVNAPGHNPPLPPRCGMNVVLVLDESSSIPTFTGAVAATRNAADAFVGALSGTGSRLAIVAFSVRARVGVDYDIVNSGSVSRFTDWIHNRPGSTNGYNPTSGPTSPHNGTNWHAAFEEVKRLNLVRTATLVVFVTDGDPNAHLNEHNQPVVTATNEQSGRLPAMSRAWKAANEVKGEGSRVFAIGVGPAVTTEPVVPGSADRLTAVSGNVEFHTGGDFATSDFTLLERLDELGAKLHEIVTDLCAPSVTIQKFVETPSGQTVAGGPEWNFAGNLTTSSGGHEWVEPNEGSTASEVTATSNEDGLAFFKWTPTVHAANSALHVTAIEREGFTFDRAICRINGGAPETFHANQFSLTLHPDQFATCEVFNIEHVPEAMLTVNKVLSPSTDDGLFDLMVNGHVKALEQTNGGTTGPIPLAPGAALVKERISKILKPEFSLDQYEISTECVNAAGAVVVPPTARLPVKVELADGEHVTCTITNTRAEEPPPPPPPPPPTPPDPCSNGPAPTPECDGSDPGPMVSATRLAIHKTIPAHAHVGHGVPITITVRNVGDHTAIGVTVTETPPAGGKAIHAGNHGSIRQDGTVVWHLGNLASGAKQTVHARGLVTRAGLHVNGALAGARNAVVVRASESVRARLRRPARPRPPAPPPPVVTG